MRVEPTKKLVLGLTSGAAFGALLQKGQLASYDVILDQLLLRDGRVGKVMGTAIAVGAIGVHRLIRTGHAKLDIKPLKLGGIVPGAVLFGVGLSLLGYCPGTALAALGEGRRDAVAGVLGMLTGAALFVKAYPKLEPMLEAGNLGKVTLPAATRTATWPWLAALAALTAAGSMFTSAPRSRRPFSQRLAGWRANVSRAGPWRWLA